MSFHENDNHPLSNGTYNEVPHFPVREEFQALWSKRHPNLPLIPNAESPIIRERDEKGSVWLHFGNDWSVEVWGERWRGYPDGEWEDRLIYRGFNIVDAVDAASRAIDTA